MNLNNLNKYVLEDITSPTHPSDYIKDDNVLILRLPFINSGNIIVKSLAFIIDNEDVYEYDRDNRALIKIGNVNSLHNRLDKIIDDILIGMKDFHIKIDDLEDCILDNNIDIMDRWLKLKKSISLIRRLIFQASIVFDIFLVSLKKYVSLNLKAFEDLNEHIERIKNLSISAEDKLNNLYDFYRAKTDE